jgi:hypothetical protein
MPERTKKKDKRRRVPLTEEEGAGQGQFQPDLSNQFADPMDLLGSLFQPQGGGTAPSGAIPLEAAGGTLGRGGNDQTQMLQGLRDLYLEQLPFAREQLAKQPTVQEYYTAKAQAQDPVAWEQKQREARLARDPWGPGGQFAGRRAADLYTPEEILATQGNTAENQIKSLRKPITEEQRSAGEFDPEELRRLNQQYAAMRTYT